MRSMVGKEAWKVFWEKRREMKQRRHMLSKEVWEYLLRAGQEVLELLKENGVEKRRIDEFFDRVQEKKKMLRAERVEKVKQDLVDRLSTWMGDLNEFWGVVVAKERKVFLVASPQSKIFLPANLTILK